MKKENKVVRLYRKELVSYYWKMVMLQTFKILMNDYNLNPKKVCYCYFATGSK